MLSNSRKPKVFVSHASSDLWVARQLVTHSRSAGADTFLDEQQIDYGNDFEDIIVAEAEDSTELLVLFTPVSSERRYIWLELGIFMGLRKPITPVLYGVTAPQLVADPRMPVLLKKKNCVDINNVEGYFDQLKTRVRDWSLGNGG